jgi:hypothetical protein
MKGAGLTAFVACIATTSALRSASVSSSIATAARRGPSLRPTRRWASDDRLLLDEAPAPVLCADAHPRARAALAVAAVALRAAAGPALALDGPPLPSAAPGVYEPRGVTPQDTVVFLIGTVPFLWAAWEFWRRIAVGASFGTGKDSIVIAPEIADGLVDDADEDQLRRFGGRRVLGNDAISAAYVLMTVAAGSVALALYSAATL